MRFRTRAAVVLVTTLVVTANAAIAWAYFSSMGTGSTNASVGTLSAPTAPGVNASPTAAPVHVTWTGVGPPRGSTAVGYWVRRSNGATATDVCGSSKTSPISAGTGAKSCDDTSVAVGGPYTYTVTSVWRSWTAQSGSSSAVTVTTLDHFNVSASTSAPTAGTAFNVTVTAKDASNATIAGYTGTVHFTSSDAQATLPSDYTFVSGDNGVHAFNSAVTLKTAGGQSVNVKDTSQTTKTGTTSVTVSAAGLDHFAVANPGTQVAGTAFNLSITAQDLYNNTVTGYTGSKSLTFSGPGSAPNGTAPSYPSSVSFGVGTASPSVTLSKAQATTLTVSDGTHTGTSASFTVNTGTATKLAWTHVTAGGTLSSPCLFTCTDTALGNNNTFTANVSVTDTWGNTVSNLGSGHTVTVSTPSSGAGSGGVFTPGNTTSVTLTIASSGTADSTAQFTFKTQNGNWTSDTLAAQTLAGTVYASASATVTKN